MVSTSLGAWHEYITVASGPNSLSVTEALSGVTGSISLASWIFLFVPQLLENYHNQHADGLSLVFILIWTIGDIANLVGAIWANLVPTIIAIGVYFCFADAVVLLQASYYKLRNRNRSRRARGRQRTGGTSSDTASGSEDTEETLIPEEEDPLLDREPSPNSPVAVRRRSNSSQKTADVEEVAPRIDQKAGLPPSWTRDLVSVALVIVIGTCGWAIAWQAGAWRLAGVGDGEDELEDGGTNMALGAQILGYFSAVCYLGARIPQIWKNYKCKSCEGLSRLFFMLSVLGNVSYAAGILFHSLEPQYVLTNLPWLVGSLGTLVEDLIIFFQFHIYRHQDE